MAGGSGDNNNNNICTLWKKPINIWMHMGMLEFRPHDAQCSLHKPPLAPNKGQGATWGGGSGGGG